MNELIHTFSRILRFLIHYILKKRWLLLLVSVVMYGLSWTYPSRSFYTPHDKAVNQLDFPYTIVPKHVCSKDSSPEVLVIVLSIVDGTSKRKAIRETWGRSTSWPSRHISTSIGFVYFFALPSDPAKSTQLQEEADEFGDVLQIGIVEAYGINVTQKILMALKWASQSCSQTRYIMKVDDDVFVDVPVVVSQLQSFEFTPYIAGHVLLVGITIRSGKYAMSFKEYPYLFIPSYIFGYFYVMPMDVASRLVKASIYVPYVTMEDVYITAILSRTTRTPLKAFRTFFADRNFEFDICDFVSGRRVASVDVSPEQMYTVWNTYKNDKMCLSSGRS